MMGSRARGSSKCCSSVMRTTLFSAGFRRTRPIGFSHVMSRYSDLKTAYRDLIEEFYRRGANTVGKQHFTFLYSQARSAAFTSRNISGPKLDFTHLTRTEFFKTSRNRHPRSLMAVIP